MKPVRAPWGRRFPELCPAAPASRGGLPVVACGLQVRSGSGKPVTDNRPPLVRIALATCLEKPQLQPSDRLLAGALEARGFSAAAHPWNGPFEPFARADAVIVRSTWDYVPVADQFAEWVGRLEREARRAFNPPRLMRWNLEKTYLLDLGARGAPLPPTALAEPGAEALKDALGRLSLKEAVVKPVIGGGAAGVSIVAADQADSFARAAARLRGRALVQPLLPEIRTRGETSLIYFGGQFSHAVEKRPPAGSILVQEEHGGWTGPAHPRPQIIEAGRRILDLLPERPLYARVDVVLGDEARLDQGLQLMEVEVIEPELFLTHAEGAAGRFADALLCAMRE